MDRHAGYDKRRIFLVSLLALVMAGTSASLRSNIASDLQGVFLDPIDKAHSAGMVATILGVPFGSFALTIAIGSPLLDVIGMGLLLPLSGVLLLIGTLLFIFAGGLAAGPGIYAVLCVAAVVTGIGWAWWKRSSIR